MQGARGVETWVVETLGVCSPSTWFSVNLLIDIPHPGISKLPSHSLISTLPCLNNFVQHYLEFTYTYYSQVYRLHSIPTRYITNPFSTPWKPLSSRQDKQGEFYPSKLKS